MFPASSNQRVIESRGLFLGLWLVSLGCNLYQSKNNRVFFSTVASLLLCCYRCFLVLLFLRCASKLQQAAPVLELWLVNREDPQGVGYEGVFCVFLFILLGREQRCGFVFLIFWFSGTCTQCRDVIACGECGCEKLLLCRHYCMLSRQQW